MIKKMIVGFVLVFLILMIPRVIRINQNQFNGPMKEMAKFFQKNLQPGDIFIHGDVSSWGVFCHYFPDHQEFFYLNHSNPDYVYCKNFTPNGSAGLDLQGFLRDKHPVNIWLVDGQTPGKYPVTEVFDPRSILESKTFTTARSWFVVRVYKIKPR